MALKLIYNYFFFSNHPVFALTGENGAAVHLQSNERMKAEITINEFGFNMVASDKVAMDRVIPDTRHKEYVVTFCIIFLVV